MRRARHWRFRRGQLCFGGKLAATAADGPRVFVLFLGGIYRTADVGARRSAVAGLIS